jgi:cell division protein FtsB
MLPRLRTYLPTAALAFLIFYFVFHALTGDRGLLLAAQKREALLEKKQELARLREQRADLEQRVKFMRNEHLSADLLEERAHVQLGFVDARDYVIRLKASRN